MRSWGQTHRNYHTRAGPVESTGPSGDAEKSCSSQKCFRLIEEDFRSLNLSLSPSLLHLFLPLFLPLHRKSCSFLSVVICLSFLPKHPIVIIIKISQVSLKPLAVPGRFSQTCFYFIISVFLFCFIELYFMFSFIIKKSTIPHKSSKFNGSITGQWISRNPMYEVRQWP